MTTMAAPAPGAGSPGCMCHTVDSVCNQISSWFIYPQLKDQGYRTAGVPVPVPSTLWDQRAVNRSHCRDFLPWGATFLLSLQPCKVMCMLQENP